MKNIHHTSRIDRPSAVTALRKQPLSGRGVRAVWLTGVGCWALISTPSLVTAAPAPSATGKGSVRVQVNATMLAPEAVTGPRLRVVTGRSLRINLAQGAQYRVASGADKIGINLTDAGLEITGQQS